MEGHAGVHYTMAEYVKRWFLVEYDGNIEVRQYEAQRVPEKHGYIVKAGCFREFVPEDKVYETKEAAEAKRQELIDELTSV